MVTPLGLEIALLALGSGILGFSLYRSIQCNPDDLGDEWVLIRYHEVKDDKKSLQTDDSPSRVIIS